MKNLTRRSEEHRMAAIIESKHINRREFVKELAVATLAIQIAPLAQACDSLDEEDPAVSGNALIATSTDGLFGHFHRLSILRELLESPPAQGIALETTRSLFHRHSVRLSAEELLAIGSGKTVTRQISSHRLVICLGCGVAALVDGEIRSLTGPLGPVRGFDRRARSGSDSTRPRATCARHPGAPRARAEPLLTLRRAATR
jgi:hypothetical protein